MSKRDKQPERTPLFYLRGDDPDIEEKAWRALEAYLSGTAQADDHLRVAEEESRGPAGA